MSAEHLDAEDCRALRRLRGHSHNTEKTKQSLREERELLSVWSFFQYLVADMPDAIFITTEDSIVARYREVLDRRWNIPIKTVGDVVGKGP